jgi:hypothetical protein
MSRFDEPPAVSHSGDESRPAVSSAPPRPRPGRQTRGDRPAGSPRADHEPVFDEARVVDELDGDRALLFEIVQVARRKIRASLDALIALPADAPEARRVAAELAEQAGRIRAWPLERRARETIATDLSPGPLAEAIARLEREAERFLAETRWML